MSQSQSEQRSKGKLTDAIILVGYVVLSILVVLVAHFFLDIRFDVHVAYFKVASVFVALALGFQMRAKLGYRIVAALLVGVVVAVLSVTGMSTIVWVVRGYGSILPASAKDWQDVIEYCISFPFGTVVGNILANSYTGSPGTSNGLADLLSRLAKFIAETLGSAPQSDVVTNRVLFIERLLKALTAVVLAGGALFAAIKSIFF